MSQRAANRSRRIFFSAGEPSGDLHAANLIRELRRADPSIECFGYGGPRMQEAGCRLEANTTAMAVMWFLKVLLNLHKFWELYKRADRIFAAERLDAVVLIDYPGFNWWIARCARQHDVPVFYYCPPQVWAWARWRMKKMRRLVDHVLCGLPFERKWYADHGCRAVLVGHPFVDEVRERVLDHEFIAQIQRDQQPLITLLPGSRTQELDHNLRLMLRAAKRVQLHVPETRLALACVSDEHARTARQAVAAAGIEAEVHAGRTPELIHAATCCMAVSGSVSLELLCHAKPTVIVYQVSRTGYAAQHVMRKVRYITLVNLLASDDALAPRTRASERGAGAPEAQLFPEYLTWRDCSEQMAAHVVRWLTDEPLRAACVRGLHALREELPGGAARAAAEYIMAEITDAGHPIPSPHWDAAATSATRHSTTPGAAHAGPLDDG